MQLEAEMLARKKRPTVKDYERLNEDNLNELLKMGTTIANLQALASDDAPAEEVVELSEVVGRYVKMASDRRIKNSVPKGLRVKTARKILFQVFDILRDNAFKYGATKLEIGASENGRRIFVRDNGDGIAKKDLPHIFDRFYRGGEADATSGRGLGLPLARKLARAINAKITVESRPGAGTTFYISLRRSKIIKNKK
jgi:signal transduction histidine kinase